MSESEGGERDALGPEARRILGALDPKNGERAWVCSPNTNQPLPGAVVDTYRTVGDKTYSPYHSRVWRDEDGKQRKAYVRPEDLEATRLACEAHRALKRSGGQAARRAARRRAKSLGASFEAVMVASEAIERFEAGERPEGVRDLRVRSIMELLGGTP